MQADSIANGRTARLSTTDSSPAIITFSNQMDLNPGARLGPYEIVSRIGAGGMGEVFKGRDTRLDRSVAIKVLPRDVADNPQTRARFEREAKTISQLNHPHICTIHDFGDEGGTSYLVMELVEGETLAEIHPAIAPDGKMFAFVRESEANRDIFLQRVDGRSAINLTADGKVNDDELAFSPDGTESQRPRRSPDSLTLAQSSSSITQRTTSESRMPSPDRSG